MKMYLRGKSISIILIYMYNIMSNIKICIIAGFTNMNFHKRLLTFLRNKKYIFYISNAVFRKSFDFILNPKK